MAIWVPHIVTHVDWSSGQAGARTSTIFDDPQPDIVWQNAAKAAATGPVPYCRSTRTINVGDGDDLFEIGIHRWMLPASLNAECNVPVYQVMLVFSTRGTHWPTYPAMDTYDPATSNTFLAPFKLEVACGDGTPWRIFEMRDLKCLNDPSLSQTRNATQAWRPHTHIAMVLEHTSHRLSVSNQYYKGTDAALAMRPRQAKKNSSSNAIMVNFASLNQQYNGFLLVAAMPPLAMPASFACDTLYPKQDIYLDNPSDPSGTGNDGVRRPTMAVGVYSEYGSMNAGHDWAPGPGGQRDNRDYVPGQVTKYMTQPTGFRTQGSMPYLHIFEEYGKGFFHMGYHFVRNARTLETLPRVEVRQGLWKMALGYYNPQPVTTGLERRINTHCVPNGGTWPAPDKNGKRHYHGFYQDFNHGYDMPGWYSLLTNSVTHAISMQMCWLYGIMASTTNAGYGKNPVPLADPLGGYFLQREHSWRWEPLVFMWQQASLHPLFTSQEDIEADFQLELESVYDNVLVPTTDPQHPNYNHLTYKCLRNLGVVGRENVIGANHRLSGTSDGKFLYLFGVLVLMKTTGCMAAMRARSAKCNAAIDFVLNCIGTHTVTQFNATKGRNLFDPNTNPNGPTLTTNVPLATPIEVPDSWDAWVALYQPDDGSDLITKADGTRYGDPSDSFIIERTQYQHLFMRAIWGFRDHFPELNFPDTAAAAAMCDQFEQTVIDRIAAGQPDYRWRSSSFGPIALA